MTKKLFAEFFGTFWLVLGGCGTAVLAGSEMGTVGISLAFGFTVLTMAYAVGHISGGHFNPAVTLGLVAGKRFPAKQALSYIGVQIVGACLAALVLYIIMVTSDKTIGDFATNGYGAHSPAGFKLGSVLLTEFILTMLFIMIIMGVTDVNGNRKMEGLAIGIALALIHLISIPVSNTSVNPARSISQAIFVGGDALKQLWVFIIAPIAGGIVGGLIYKCLLQQKEK